jgi:hypothetical protein
MYKAKEELQTEDEKAFAQNIIDGFVAEMQAESEVETITYEVVVSMDNSKQYSLLYNIVDGDSEITVPLSEMFVKEDEDEKRDLGYNTIKELIHNEFSN